MKYRALTKYIKLINFFILIIICHFNSFGNIHATDALIVTEQALNSWEEETFLYDENVSALPCPPTSNVLDNHASALVLLSEQIDEVLDYEHSRHFDFKNTFSPLATFFKNNPGINGDKVFEGGLVDGNTGQRIDLTIYDMTDQIEFLINKHGSDEDLYEFKNIVGDDPIGNFPKLYDWFNTLASNDSKINRESKKLILQNYSFEGFAAPVGQGIFGEGGIRALSHNRFVKNYNRVMNGRNADLVMQQIRSEYFPDRKIPLTVAKLRELRRRKINQVVQKVNKAEFDAAVNVIVRSSPGAQLRFRRGRDGAVILRSGKIGDNKINRTTIDLFNYVNNNTHSGLLNQIEQRTDRELTTLPSGQRVLLPSDIAGNEELLSDIVSEHSWETHISMGDDNVLLIVRKWMKENQDDIIKLVSERNADNQELLDELKKWQDGKKPPRRLTIDLYPLLTQLYPDQPWADNAEFFDERGRPSKIGANGFQRTMSRLGHIVKNITRPESLASSATGLVMTSATGNPIISAGSATVVHDKIYEMRHGYEPGEYMRENTARNAAVSMVIASGFKGGRMSDAVFRGGVNGGMQAATTGRPVHIGIIVGGAQGATLQALPPGVSKWVVSGDNKTANIVTEIAENATFTGARGAMIAYFDDGDWQTGMREGAMTGAAVATGKIILLGPRYDAQEHLTDEEIERYNHIHNYESGHFHDGTVHFHSENMSERYAGKRVIVTRDDLRRMNFRTGGIIGTSPGASATNYGNFAGNEIVMGEAAEERGKTIMHEGNHTIQATLGGRANFLIFGLSGGKEAGALWEEYLQTDKVLPSNYLNGGYYFYAHPSVFEN